MNNVTVRRNCVQEVGKMMEIHVQRKIKVVETLTLSEKEDFISLVLWSARRLNPIHREYVYDEIDRITGQQHKRL